MKVLLQTNDPVVITYVRAVLSDEDIVCFVVDQHVSVLEGSIGAIPRRIMVLDRHHRKACRIVDAAQGTRGWFSGESGRKHVS